MYKKFALGLAVVAVIGCGNSNDFNGVFTNSPPSQPSVPADIAAVFNQAKYQNSIWGLRVLDTATGEVLLDNRPNNPQFFIASVRKCFSVGALLEAMGGEHTYDTPVYTQGDVDGAGVLDGDLVLVASGDLTMGGRQDAEGRIEVTNFDHNEANGLGNAVLSSADPLTGYKDLARQVADSGITRITGEVVIDDRLFEAYPFREEDFEVTPAFVNDDLVDLTINPTAVGSLASVQVRPISSALTIVNDLTTSAAGTEFAIDLDPTGDDTVPFGGSGTVSGDLPIDFVPDLTGAFPIIRTFRISEPTNYVRTVFIEALEAEGVMVDADTVEANPVTVLPLENTYLPEDRVAFLEGSTISDMARYVMKVSYNIGADVSLLQYGLANGVDNMTDALTEEAEFLTTQVGISPTEYDFIDGSGGGDTTATMKAVTTMLDYMHDSDEREDYIASMPSLGIDGSLNFVKDFQSNPTLAGATGKVNAKTGTYVDVDENGAPIIKAQSLAGFIDTRSGRRLTFMVVVNNAPFEDINSVLPLFQDEGTISAILWRDY